jgi:hypothetical protein
MFLSSPFSCFSFGSDNRERARACGNPDLARYRFRRGRGFRCLRGTPAPCRLRSNRRVSSSRQKGTRPCRYLRFCARAFQRVGERLPGNPSCSLRGTSAAAHVITPSRRSSPSSLVSGDIPNTFISTTPRARSRRTAFFGRRRAPFISVKKSQHRSIVSGHAAFGAGLHVSGATRFQTRTVEGQCKSAQSVRAAPESVPSSRPALPSGEHDPVEQT